MALHCPRCGAEIGRGGRCESCTFATSAAQTQDDIDDATAPAGFELVVGAEDDAASGELPSRDAKFTSIGSLAGLQGLERRFVERVDGATSLSEVGAAIGVNLLKAQLLARELLRRKLIDEPFPGGLDSFPDLDDE